MTFLCHLFQLCVVVALDEKRKWDCFLILSRGVKNVLLKEIACIKLKCGKGDTISKFCAFLRMKWKSERLESLTIKKIKASCFDNIEGNCKPLVNAVSLCPLKNCGFNH